MTTPLVLGEITIHPVVEQQGAFFDALSFFPNLSKEVLDENRNWLRPEFIDAQDRLVLCIQSFVIKTPRHNILIDACVGNHKPRPTRPFWNMLNSDRFEKGLAVAGLTVDDIDYVMCTHLHTDHVGWNTRLENGRWVPTFPNARYLIAQREWDYWRAAGPAAFAWTGDYITDSVLPIFKSGQAELIGDGHTLASDIALETAPGHTPGLTLVRLSGGRHEAIMCSDLMHHPLQVRYPTWSTRFCVDPDQARLTRIEFFKKHADSGRLVFPTHFPTPTGGTIARDGADYHFVFDGEVRPAILP